MMAMHLSEIDFVVRDFKVILRKSNYYYAIEWLEAGTELELEVLLPVAGLRIQRRAIA